MLTSLAFVFLLGLAMAALCQRIKIPPYHRYADHRYFIGTLCIKLAFRFGFGDFFRAAADGTDHHIAESRIVPESGRSEGR